MRLIFSTSIFLLLSCQAASKYSTVPDLPDFSNVPDEVPLPGTVNITVTNGHLYGFQSGGFHSNVENIPDTSSSYGNSLHYDPKSSLVYVTGATYWSYWDRVKHTEESVSDLAQLDHSDCFFAVLEPPGVDEPDSNTMDLLYTRRLGKRAYDEACSAQTIVRSNSGETKIVQSGHTEEGGILTDTRGWGSPISKMYGILFSYDLGVISNEFGKPGVSEHLSGARLLNDHRVQYPAAITSNPVPDRSEDEIYKVSISSDYNGPNNGINRGKLPDLTYVEEPDFGHQFAVSIEKIIPKTQDEIDYEEAEAALVSGLIVNGQTHEEGIIKDTMKAEWTVQFTPELNRRNISTKHYLRVSEMLYAPHFEVERFDLLIVVGTTTGFGSIFGDPSLNPDLDDTFPMDTETKFKDGFVSFLGTDGSVLDAARLSTGVHDVVIHGACIDETEHHSARNVYVVGETMGHLDRDMKKQNLSTDKNGDIAKHAFISKIDLLDMELVWTRQMGGSLAKDVASYGCAVTPGEEMVYMAGTISGGDMITVPNQAATESFGNDDIFVAQFDSETGNLNYVKQHGTSYNDSLAKGSGIVSDKDGNAIILGNTQGSLMRWREEAEGEVTMIHHSDIFVLSVDKETGTMLVSAEIIGPPEDTSDSKNRGKNYIFHGADKLLGPDMFAITVGVIIALFTSLYIGYSATQARTSDKRSHEKIMEYLEDFNDREYNLHTKSSATGGVHGVYSVRYPELSNDELDDLPAQRNLKTTRKSTSTRNYRHMASSIDNDISEIKNETRNFSSPNKAKSEPTGMSTIDLLSSDATVAASNAKAGTPPNSASSARPPQSAFTSSQVFFDQIKELPSSNTTDGMISSRPSTGISYARSDDASHESDDVSFGEIL